MSMQALTQKARPTGAIAGLFAGKIMPAFLLAGISLSFFSLVWIYGNALRDPRYLDGWVLAGAMIVQIAFHIMRRIGISARSAERWKKPHVFLGYLVIAAFLSHTSFSLPDTGFEWALWSLSIAIATSGVLGTYLVWSFARRGLDNLAPSSQSLTVRFIALEQEYHTLADSETGGGHLDLPDLPHDAWIRDLCTTRLESLFSRHRNFFAHLAGSQQPVKQLTDAIDGLAKYVDKRGRARLKRLKELVVEKDRLDLERTYLVITRLWLLIHVPATYAALVLTVAHVLVVYAYASGLW